MKAGHGAMKATSMRVFNAYATMNQHNNSKKYSFMQNKEASFEHPPWRLPLPSLLCVAPRPRQSGIATARSRRGTIAFIQSEVEGSTRPCSGKGWGWVGETGPRDVCLALRTRLFMPPSLVQATCSTVILSSSSAGLDLQWPRFTSHRGKLRHSCLVASHISSGVSTSHLTGLWFPSPAT